MTDGGRPVKMHWDGKSIQNISGHKLVERIPVKAVCDGIEQILSCPRSGKQGIHVMETVWKAIQDWELEDFVVSLCFDTTRVNSGRIKGAAVLLEKKLGRALQFLPCRHHIYELILKLLYSKLLEVLQFMRINQRLR